MKEMIEIFQMGNIDPKVRARIIINLGDALNMQMGSNYTEPIVYELVNILDPSNAILNQDRYKKV